AGPGGRARRGHGYLSHHRMAPPRPGPRHGRWPAPAADGPSGLVTGGRPEVQPSTKRAEQPGVSWLSLKTPAQAAAASARADADRADAATALAAAITAELTACQATTPAVSYDDAVALVCRATGWPVGHVW